MVDVAQGGWDGPTHAAHVALVLAIDMIGANRESTTLLSKMSKRRWRRTTVMTIFYNARVSTS